MDLCAASPAPYSAYLRLGDYHIVSSTPERFLTLDSQGRAETRPIKGTTPRFADMAQDELSRKALEKSVKDRSENLMIVDLMRNDFGRGSVFGSVEVEDLFQVTSYATLHHMASTVKGQKRHGVSSLDFVKACFPPGSMTGAPKVRAMEICSELERHKRGVYSGAIGWFGGDGSVDLAVVIRTLVLRGTDFEFQVGGAVVADSTPEGEWHETLVKARGIARVLGLEPERDLGF